jgi:hypothetical protein
MMKCKRCRSFFPEALYGELSRQQEEQFYAHLEHCPACAAEFKKMQSTLKVMNRRERPKLNQAYWQGFWQRFEDSISESPETVPISDNLWQRFMTRISFNKRWLYQSAAAMAILLAGILVGKYYLNGPQQNQVANPANSFYASNTPLVQQTTDYLSRSKILLLGLVNFDPQTDDHTALDLGRQQMVSHELLQEGYDIKKRIDPRNQQLQELITDLEVILLQIANLEAEQDIPAIEMVKSGVDRRALLMKINIEEMRRLNSNEDDQHKSEK